MYNTNRVIWKEGMFLQPQHFQQAERSLLNTINARLASLTVYGAGFTEIVIDKESIANGLFTLSRCSGILPDGTFFDVPREDPPPPVRSFSDHLSVEQQSLDVYLALPVVIEGRANVAMGQTQTQGATRYRNRAVQVTDEVAGTVKKEIETGAACFAILFGDESLDNYASLRIAKLVRNPNGQVSLMEAHMPPLLHIGASPWCMSELRNLLQVLMARISSLSQGRKQVEGGFAEFSGGEETAFRLLQTLNMYTPLLAHHHLVSTVNPYEVFCLLSQLAGALCTFSVEYGIGKLPRYDHFNLGATFASLFATVRGILNADISAGCVNVPIQQLNQATFLCQVPDERLFATAKFYLGVSAKAPEKELIVGVVQRIKMCSRERLDLLISSAMPGLPLMHVSSPPEGLSTKPGFMYFSLDQQGAFWEGMKTTGSISFYFPNKFPDLKLEMLALKV